MRSPSSNRRRPARRPKRGKAARCATGCTGSIGPVGMWWSMVEPFLSELCGVETSARLGGSRWAPPRRVFLLSFARLAALGAGRAGAVRGTTRAHLTRPHAALEAVLDAQTEAVDVVPLHGAPLAV